jgi:hypothetical protein
MDDKITNFLKERNPLYVDSDTLTIKLPLGKDRDMDFAHILGNYSTPWLFTMRGYYKEDYAMLYINDYECFFSNLTIRVATPSQDVLSSSSFSVIFISLRFERQ